MSLRSSPSFAVGGILFDPEKNLNDLPPWGWRCFHCAEDFPASPQGIRAAKRHFGITSKNLPACVDGLDLS